jgi:hypothetical protein
MSTIIINIATTNFNISTTTTATTTIIYIIIINTTTTTTTTTSTTTTTTTTTTTAMSINAYMRALYVATIIITIQADFISYPAIQNPTSLHPLALKSLYNSRVLMSACRSPFLPLYHYLSLSPSFIIHHSIIHSLLYYLTIIVIDQSVLNPQLINLSSDM